MKLSTEKLSQLIGQRFGFLTVENLFGKKGRKFFYTVRCDCGSTKEVQRDNLLSGHTQSCGCLLKKVTTKRSTKHGGAKRGSHTAEYYAWLGMKGRCLTPTHKKYEYYGGRGIMVCERWINSFENFLKDVGLRPSLSHSIDREDVNGNYEPDNCRWATKLTQANNKRNNVFVSYEGKQYSIAQLARHLGLNYRHLYELHRTYKVPLTEAIARARKL